MSCLYGKEQKTRKSYFGEAQYYLSSYKVVFNYRRFLFSIEILYEHCELFNNYSRIYKSQTSQADVLTHAEI